jgi:hypothetical protein
MSGVPNDNRFDYVAYDTLATEAQLDFKARFKDLANATVTQLPPGRAQSIVLTKLEEAYMWVGKAIRDAQVQRNGSAPLQEGRTTS